MPLSQGARVGPYEVEAPIGAGGMGEVYRARDIKLNRMVALKTLPADLAADADRLARFRREAQVLASLNHPNIAAIYGLEDSGGTLALVMELVPGRTLAEIMTAPLPVADALGMAKQIATALEAAHEQGIVHRDLKPANVKITDEGTVKVLDFGLAKAIGGDGSRLREQDPSPYTANSPTLTTPAMTAMGVILGTAGYMSPEQAKGRPADRRADIWALGVVLFEMLTGRALYRGETVTETIAHVITQPPAWEALPASTPPAVRRLLRRSLEKDPRNRIQSAGDVRLEIDECLAPADGEAAATASAQAPVGAQVPAWRRAIPWSLAAVLLVALVAAIWPTPAPASRPVRLEVQLDGGPLAVDENVDGAVAVVSPDGQSIAYLAGQGADRRLYLRSLDRLESTPLSGTEDAAQHFFSPDGRSIAFFASGALKRVSLSGGAPVPIASTSEIRGGTWGSDDTIVFTNGLNAGLSRVAASGGTPVEITELAENERTHRWPSFLPDGRTVLFMCQRNDASYDEGTIEAVRLETGERTVLVRGGTFPRFAPPGYLVFTRQNTLFGVKFDPDRLEVQGEPQPLVSGVLSAGAGVGSASGNGAAQVSIAESGTAVYLPGVAEIESALQLAVVDRTGTPVYTYPERRPFKDPKVSPDGTRIAVRMSDGKTEQLHVLDLARGTLTKVTFDGTVSMVPAWTPDAQHLLFGSDRSGKGGLDLFMMRSDGSGDVTAIASHGPLRSPGSFSPDGSIVAASELNPRTNWDLILVSRPDGRVTPFLDSPAVEMFPQFSPDGRWLAYQRQEASGVPHVFVRTFPDGGSLRQVSSSGGGLPFWTKNGAELVYATPASGAVRISAVSVTAVGDALELGTPQPLFELPMATPGNATYYHVSPDGSRFVVLLGAEGASGAPPRTHVTVVFNFLDELRRVLDDR